jgi:hypothetical protein
MSNGARNMKPINLSFSSLAATLLAAVVLQSAVSSRALAQSGLAVQAPAHYIVTRADMRKCAYPFCGGYYVKAVNRALTKCADGSLQKECHAVELDTKALGWTDEQRAAFERGFAQGQALVLGTLSTAAVQSVAADVLAVSQAWQGQALSKPAGTFYEVRSTGIVCITTPCPSLAATRLNSTNKPVNPDLNLSKTGASADQIQAGYEALGASGILVAGNIRSVRLAQPNGGTRLGSQLVASEFYVPAKP